jgi:putative ABC transport system permease protein
MYFLRLIFKNIFRAKLRSGLTLLALVVAILAFGMLQTVVGAWYAGADMASANRLITRNAISLIFSLPSYYKDRVKAIDGVQTVTANNWFGGIYKEPANFFPQFAVDHNTFFEQYPEFIVKPEELAAWKADRRGAMVGRRLAETYGFKVGDTVPIQGTIFPGTWQFTVRGIYDPKDDTTVTRQFYFQWDYLNEQLKRASPRRAEQVGTWIVTIKDSSRAAEISQAIDAEFKNSLAETLTETEKAFQLGFVAQSEAIVVAISVVSYVVIVIILAVVANTMAMTARERLGEYATLKALGFSPTFVGALVMGESILMTMLGGLIGIALTFPLAAGFKASPAGQIFAVFNVSPETLQLQFACALAVGILAALVPAIRSARIKIVDGLRAVA